MILEFLQVFALASPYVNKEWVGLVFHAQRCDREEFEPVFASSPEGHAHYRVEGLLVIWVRVEEIEIVSWCAVCELEWPV